MTQLVTDTGGPVLLLKPGQTATLGGGKGTVTFTGIERYAGLTVRHDPGKTGALVFALLAIAGLVLSLSVRRRRVFVRLDPDPSDPRRTVVRVAGLARGEDAGLAARGRGGPQPGRDGPASGTTEGNCVSTNETLASYSNAAALLGHGRLRRWRWRRSRPTWR